MNKGILGKVAVNSFLLVIAILGIFLIFPSISFSRAVPSGVDFYLNQTANWSAGTFVNTSGSAEEYNHTANYLEMSFPYADADPNLVSYYKMDSETDLVNGLDGTASGAVFQNSGGIYSDGHTYFDGVSDVIKVPANSLHDYIGTDGSSDQGFSILVWANLSCTGADSNEMIVGKSNASGSQYQWILANQYASTGLRFILYDGLNSGNYLQGAYAYDNDYCNKYVMITATYDGNNESTAGLKLYMNGALVSSTNAETGTYVRMLPKNGLSIGGAIDSTSYDWKGTLDEVKLYNDTLTDGEILQMYNTRQKYIGTNDMFFNITASTTPNIIDDYQWNLTDGSGSNWFVVNNSIRLGFYDDFDDGSYDRTERWNPNSAWYTRGTYTEENSYMKISCLLSNQPQIASQSMYLPPFNWSTNYNYSNSSTTRTATLGMNTYGSSNGATVSQRISQIITLDTGGMWYMYTYEGNGVTVDTDLQYALDDTNRLNFFNATGIINATGHTTFLINDTGTGDDYAKSYTGYTQGEVALTYSGTIWVDWYYINTTWANYTTRSLTIPDGYMLKNFTIDYTGADANYYIKNVTFRGNTGAVIATNLTALTSGTSVTYSDANGLDTGSFSNINGTSDLYIEIEMVGDGRQDVLQLTDMYGYYENQEREPSFTSAPINITTNYMLTNLTIDYTNVDSQNYIDKIELLNSTGDIKASYNTSNMSKIQYSLRDNMTFWRFEGDLTDEVYGATGTGYNISYEYGKFDQSLVFDDNVNSDPYISVADPNLNNNWTICGWTKRNSSGTTYDAFVGYASTKRILIHDSASMVLVQLGTGNLFSSAVYEYGQWNFICVRYNQTEDYGNQTVSVYNTSGIGTHTLLGCAVGATWTSTTYVGRSASTSEYPFNGTMDDIQFYNKTLTEAELDSLYSYSLPYYQTIIRTPKLDSGNLSYLNDTEDLKIKVYLKGNGTSTPTIQDIYGYYESSGGVTPVYTDCWYSNSTYVNLTSGITVQSNENLTCNDTSVVVTGNILNYGNLTFDNFKVLMNVSSNGEYNIFSYVGSNLTITEQSNITSNNANFGYNVIVNSTELVISNSHLSEAGWDSSNSGLIINNNNTIIDNSTFSWCQYGIMLDRTNNSIVKNSTVKYTDISGLNAISLYLYNGTNNTITNNTVKDNYGSGIYLKYSSYNNITNNFVNYSNNYADAGDGIYAYSSNYLLIDSNTVHNSWNFGIFVDISLYSDITNNNMYNNSNVPDGDCSGITIDAVNQTEIINNTIDSSRYGMIIDFGSGYNNITDNTVQNCTYGILFPVSENGEGNLFTNLNITNSTTYDIWHLSSTKDTFINLNINGTNMSLTGLRFGLDEVKDNERPSKVYNVSSYINITNLSAPSVSWVYLNLSYDDTIPITLGFTESDLQMWKNNGTWYEMPSSVDTVNNYVYYNITSFSIFGLFPDQCVYIGGNFNVTTGTTCLWYEKDYNISGNITNYGTLILNDTDLTFNMSADGSSNITTFAESTLWILNQSNITSNNTNFEYDWWNYGNLSINDSYISECGYNAGGSQGIEVNANYSTFFNNTFDSNYELRLSGSNYSTIANNIFTNAVQSAMYLQGVQYVDVINNTANDDGYGLILAGDYNEIINNSFDYSYATGIYFEGDYNNFTNNSASYGVGDGIILISGCDYNTFENTTVISNQDTGIVTIFLGYNNTFNNTNVYNNTKWEITDATGRDNKFYNTNVNGTYVDFTGYRYRLKEVKDVDRPIKTHNISTYINATNQTTGGVSWLQLNLSYNETYVSSLGYDENGLEMWKYDGAWLDTSASVNIVNNYVYKNITNFSIFGIFKDSELPLAFNLTADPNPKQLGTPGKINLTANCSDNINVSHVIVEVTGPFNSTNYTMVNQSINLTGPIIWLYEYPQWYAGLHTFKIYLNDSSNNWNTTSGGTFTVTESSLGGGDAGGTAGTSKSQYFVVNATNQISMRTSFDRKSYTLNITTFNLPTKIYYVESKIKGISGNYTIDSLFSKTVQITYGDLYRLQDNGTIYNATCVNYYTDEIAGIKKDKKCSDIKLDIPIEEGLPAEIAKSYKLDIILIFIGIVLFSLSLLFYIMADRKEEEEK